MLEIHFSGTPGKFECLLNAKANSKKAITLFDKVAVLCAVGVKPEGKPLNTQTVSSLDNYIQAALNPPEVFQLMEQICLQREREKGRSVKNSSLFPCLQGASTAAKILVLTKMAMGKLNPTTLKKEIKFLKEVEKVK